MASGVLGPARASGGGFRRSPAEELGFGRSGVIRDGEREEFGHGLGICLGAAVIQHGLPRGAQVVLRVERDAFHEHADEAEITPRPLGMVFYKNYLF